MLLPSSLPHQRPCNDITCLRFLSSGLKSSHINMSHFFSYEAERTLGHDNEDTGNVLLPATTQQTFTPATISFTNDLIYSYDVSGSCIPNDQWMSLPIYPDPMGNSYSTSPSFHDLLPEVPFIDNATPSVGFLSPDSPRIPTSCSSRSCSPNPNDLTNYGFQNPDGTWRCAYPGCSSQAVFTRGCDLRKHFNRHRKHLFCRYEGCPQATEGGFSSKKDRARHEAKHNPGVHCEWEGCSRVFSRVDNMKDHVRRIHKKRASR